MKIEDILRICDDCQHPIPSYQTEAEHAEICDASSKRCTCGSIICNPDYTGPERIDE